MDDLPGFNATVYALVREIPEGMVTTYGALAAALGDPRKAREVGWALKATPEELEVPCHRVVNREGQLSGGWAFGGPEVQRHLLELEGVHFLEDGHVDMVRHYWRPDPVASPPKPEGQDRLL